ncbi:MAG: hypothetical protein WAV84_01800, partial [Bacteroidota bacterium]
AVVLAAAAVFPAVAAASAAAALQAAGRQKKYIHDASYPDSGLPFPISRIGGVSNAASCRLRR